MHVEVGRGGRDGNNGGKNFQGEVILFLVSDDAETSRRISQAIRSHKSDLYKRSLDSVQSANPRAFASCARSNIAKLVVACC